VVWQDAVSGVVEPTRSGKNVPAAVEKLLGRLPDAG